MHKTLLKLLPTLKSKLIRFGFRRLEKLIDFALAGPELKKQINWWSSADWGDPNPDHGLGFFRLVVTKDGDIWRMYHMWIYPGSKSIVSSVQMESCGDAIVSKSEVTSLGRYRDQLRELGFPKSFLNKYPKEK